MNTADRDKCQLALEYVIKMVAERIAESHGWTINRTLEEMSQLDIFDRLSDVESALWTENPVDLAAMAETELRGGKPAPELFFM
ncbi:MAG: hypothetical protein LBT26_07160 [Clostridiales Family XIII bacterium]|jgi:hypothetical protein|nr:hypothetical protein [Clostridiales Family XIII bacterium]